MKTILIAGALLALVVIVSVVALSGDFLTDEPSPNSASDSKQREELPEPSHSQTQSMSDPEEAMKNPTQGLPDRVILELSSDLSADQMQDQIFSMLTADEMSALQYLANLSGDYLAYEAAGTALFDYYREQGDWPRAMQAFDTLNVNLTLATPLVGQFLEAYAQQDPQGAWFWLLSHPNFNGIESGALNLGKIAGASPDPQSILLQRPPDSLPPRARAAYFKGVLGEWLQHDFTQAANYLNEIPSDPTLDPAIYDLVAHAGLIDAENTMSWAENIHNEGLRRSAILETARNWSRQDSSSYETWKTQANLSPDLTAELP
ncbi:MAG: hypothetical protein AAFX93_18430 [Verrucomicrobiota bacterium]